MTAKKMLRAASIILIMAFVGCSGGGNPVEPPKKAVFQVLSRDRCAEAWNGDDFGVIVGCTVGNVGNACGDTGVRLWVLQQGIVKEQTVVPIALCPSETIYVETTLWAAEANKEPVECNCQCT